MYQKKIEYFLLEMHEKIIPNPKICLEPKLDQLQM